MSDVPAPPPPARPARPAVPARSAPTPSWSRRFLASAGVLVVAVTLTALFWPTLWAGGGLVGGDVYYYFLPQKAFFAERLQAGALPLWNPLVGNGYPQLAESQTGALYPPYWPLYRWLSLNSAYNATILGHYTWAFLGCFWLARRFRLSPSAALFAALVYTYSWFPPRVSLEWAIVGGAWLPWAVGCAENWLQSGRGRWLATLAVVLALQLLAGHFLLAFLTQLTLLVFVPARLLWPATGPLAARLVANGAILAGAVSAAAVSAGSGATNSSSASSPSASATPSDASPAHAPPRIRLLFGVALAGFAAYLLAGAQLLPTWELKRHSQRVGVTEEHNPDYGYIPLPYYAQLIAPWKWYSSEQELRQVADPARPRTNWVEAHLYFGLLPLGLALAGLRSAPRLGPDGLRWVWLLGTLFALAYTTGWLVPLTNHLPGFSFFEGPGRYGVLCTLGVALLAGRGLALCETPLWGLGRLLCWVLVFGATGTDLWLVSRMVGHAQPVEVAPVSRREASPLRQMLRTSGPTRMLNEGKNLPSLVGAGTYPVYLGLGPAAYFDPALACPQPLPFRETAPTPQQLEWLQRNGITHILSLTPIDLQRWPARQVWFGPDPCLNLPLGRPINSGFYLYELNETRGRVAWVEQPAPGTITLRTYEPERVVVETDSSEEGTVLVTDLNYPGWQVEVDGRAATPVVVENCFRGVQVPAGRHAVQWTYRPTSLYLGLGMTGLGFLLVGGLWFVGGGGTTAVVAASARPMKMDSHPTSPTVPSQ